MVLIRIINVCIVMSQWKHAIKMLNSETVLLIKFYKSLQVKACDYHINGWHQFSNSDREERRYEE